MLFRQSESNMKSVGRNPRFHVLLFGLAIGCCVLIMACGADETPVPTPSQETARHVSFTTEDGLVIRGRLFGQSDVGVALAHMYPADQTSWWQFAELLAKEGYMALAFDFRGYRESGGDRNIDLIDRDVEAALEFLMDQGASTVFLMGASMGGTAALQVAANRADAVAGVVSLSAPAEFRGISVKSSRIQVPALLMATDGDGSAKKNLERMIEDNIVGESPLTETVVYEEGNDHGTDILSGDNAAAATARILGFLKTRSR